MAEEKAAANAADKAAEKPAERAAETAAAPEAKKGKGKMMIIIGVAGLLVLGGGGFAAWHFLKPAPEGEAAAAGEHEAAKEEAAGTGIIAFEPFLANLADPGGRRYARVNVKVIVGDEHEAKEIEENAVTLARLRAAILELLTTQTAEHIVTPDGRAELRKAIAEHADGIVKPVKVEDVLFADFVVQ